MKIRRNTNDTIEQYRRRDYQFVCVSAPRLVKFDGARSIGSGGVPEDGQNRQISPSDTAAGMFVTARGRGDADERLRFIGKQNYAGKLPDVRKV